jgi:hypothetical protein
MRFGEGACTVKPIKPSDQQASDHEALASEIDHLGEDLLDAADAIDRLTRKYAEDVQKILKLQADKIKALAIDQGFTPPAHDCAPQD